MEAIWSRSIHQWQIGQRSLAVAAAALARFSLDRLSRSQVVRQTAIASVAA
jgi:hypothetical protein